IDMTAAIGSTFGNFPVAQNLDDIFLTQCFIFEKSIGEAVEIGAPFRQDLGGPVGGGIQEISNLLINLKGGLLAEIAGGMHFLAEERMLFALAKGGGADRGTPAPVGNHPAGELRCFSQVVLGSGGEFVENEFF